MNTNLDREFLIKLFSTENLIQKCDTWQQDKLDRCGRIATRQGLTGVFCELHKFKRYALEPTLLERLPGADLIEVILDHLGLGSDLKPV